MIHIAMIYRVIEMRSVNDANYQIRRVIRKHLTCKTKICEVLYVPISNTNVEGGDTV